MAHILTARSSGDQTTLRAWLAGCSVQHVAQSRAHKLAAQKKLCQTVKRCGAAQWNIVKINRLLFKFHNWAIHENETRSIDLATLHQPTTTTAIDIKLQKKKETSDRIGGRVAATGLLTSWRTEHKNQHRKVAFVIAGFCCCTIDICISISNKCCLSQGKPMPETIACRRQTADYDYYQQ